MNREEAIYCLKAQSERYSEVCEECPLYGQTGVDHCCEDALQLAITALQNQPVWMPLPEPYRESENRMANRNTLHSNKLDAFRKWLIKTGWTIEEPKGIWEVLRAKKAGRQNPLIVYQKMNKEHLSVLDRDIDVIKRFLQEK